MRRRMEITRTYTRARRLHCIVGRTVLALVSASPLPASRMAPVVGDREHHNGTGFGKIEHAIRVTLHRNPTGFSVDSGVQLRTLPNRNERGIYSVHEDFSQARALPFIPGICGCNVLLCLRADFKSERLRRVGLLALAPAQARSSRRALTSSHGTLVSGCAR
jgi:hypothetical protein